MNNQQRKWPRSTPYHYITDEMLAQFTSNLLPTSQVEITLKCRNLIKSHPYCVIQMQEPRWQKQYDEIARTETIKDTTSPQWVKKVILNYSFESVQKLKFEVWDKDLQAFLGRFETSLGDLVSIPGREFVAKLTGIPNRSCGEIIIVTEEVSHCKQIAEIQFRAENLTKLSWIWKNDPFLVLSRSNEDGSHSVVAKTEIKRSSHNPVWQPIYIRATTLCGGDFDRNIKIDCYDFSNTGSHKLIGTCHTSLGALSSPIEDQPPMILVNEKRKKRNNEEAAGVLRVNRINLIEEISFLDYIRHGTQLHFAVAIDFTASNGNPNDPKSLHFLSPHRMNSYEIALTAVGEIIQHYESSKMFSAFGFGAKLPPSGQVSHPFPLNGNPANPYCSSVEEILVHYRTQLSSVTLYGPTNFSPIIRNTTSIAREFQDGKHYFLLLIITDGIISDMHLTKHAIVQASSLPISIIIVGVGNANFDNMDELDSDDVQLGVDGQYAERDIVQFVPLNKFLKKNGTGSGSAIESQAELAREVLYEVPEQLTSYMKSRGIKPKKEPIQNMSSNYPSPTAPKPL